MMNTDNRLLTRESSEHIREFFSTVERLSVSTLTSYLPYKRGLQAYLSLDP